MKLDVDQYNGTAKHHGGIGQHDIKPTRLIVNIMANPTTQVSERPQDDCSTRLTCSLFNCSTSGKLL